MTYKKARLITVSVLLLLGAGCSDAPQEKTTDNKPDAHLVEVITVNKDSLSHTSAHTGTLRANRIIRIHNQEEGRIEQLPYYEGDHVKKGTVIARLDDQLLKAELDKAIATRKQAELDLQRLEGMMKNQLVAKEEKARAMTALEVAKSEEQILRARLGYTTISAPFDGVISERLFEPGDIAQRHSHLLTLYDPQSLLTEIPVSELLLPYVSVGDNVTVKIDALGDRSYKGKVVRVHPVLDERTRRSTVEVEISPVPRSAMVGQLCRVLLETRAQQRMAVPFKALQRDREGEYVYQVTDDNKVKRTAVRSGMRLADRVEIIDGLAEGDVVVTRGFFDLRFGRTVKISQLQPQSSARAR